MKDWKTTANGILAFLIATLTTVSSFLVAGNLIAGGTNTAAIHVSTWVVIGVNLALALCRVWVGLIQNDAPAPPAGTVPAFAPQVTTESAAVLPAGTSTPVKAVMALLVFCALGMATGCNSFERNTFNTLAASKAVIDQAQADYTSKTIPETACTYALINDAKAAQTTAVNAMLVYEQEKSAGQNLNAQIATVTADVAALPGIIAQVKALYTNPSGCATPKP